MQTSLTQIRRILRECQFNPRVPGPMEVIADAGNKSYFITRTIEMLRTEYDNADHEARGLRQAIGLLALAIAENENANAKNKNKRQS